MALLETTNKSIDEQPARTLLILESHDGVRRAYERYFRRYFEQTVGCSSVFEVERLLLRERVTDVICGHSGGVGWPAGERVRRWRALQPALRHVVLLSGALEVPALPHFDLVLSKPFEPRAIVDFLLPEHTAVRVHRLSCPLGGAR